jgi:hypothetical protein
MKRDAVIVFLALLLERRSGAQRGIESQVMRFSISRPGLNISSAFLFGLRARTSSAQIADHLVQRCIQLARDKGLAGLDF